MRRGAEMKMRWAACALRGEWEEKFFLLDSDRGHIMSAQPPAAKNGFSKYSGGVMDTDATAR